VTFGILFAYSRKNLRRKLLHISLPQFGDAFAYTFCSKHSYDKSEITPSNFFLNHIGTYVTGFLIKCKYISLSIYFQN
jgi:hypothetical protein